MKSVILAGGVGTRLWPLSREYYPKQFLKLGDHSFFQMTYLRALKLSAPDEIFIVTNEIHQYLVKNQIEELGCESPEGQVLIEPVGRNTLPAICLAMRTIRERFGDSVAVVFPSDHILGDGALEQIQAAESLASDYLITFGAQPTHPHTGYGYVKPGKPVGIGYVVDEFREKPDLETAGHYLQEGYLWNNGIFLLSTPLFFQEVERYQPGIFRAFSEENVDYNTLPSISIDYGIFEYSDIVAVVPIDAYWSDLGNFRAIYEAETKDASGNAGTAEYIGATGNYVNAGSKRVGLIGVDDLIVVDTPDALLVCNRDQSERVKELVAQLNAISDPITKLHTQVHRPWGSYTILENSRNFKLKRVTVKPGKKLSLQMHHHRSEHWVVVNGTAEVELSSEKRYLHQGESTFVEAGVRHRLGNPGIIPLEVIEVQIGEYLEEDDIVRFQDDWGRS